MPERMYAKAEKVSMDGAGDSEAARLQRPQNTGMVRGIVTALEEFLYPDSETGPLPKELRVVMARNGKPGIQILIETAGEGIALSLAEGGTRQTAALQGADGTQPPQSAAGFSAEWYEMKAVPVEYNTGDGVEQGGAMVLEQRPKEKPPYVTRLAPFRVYDCLSFQTADKIGSSFEGVMRPGGSLEKRQMCGSEVWIPAKEGRAAAYVCLQADSELPAGEYELRLHVRAAEGSQTCSLSVRVYDVEIPQDAFPVTNWFSTEAICRFHGVQEGTQAYLEMLRKYAKAMRRMHQTAFFIQLDERCIRSRKPWRFDFEYLTPEIECFFDEGLRTLELGSLLHRGFRADGAPDMYTDRFKCALDPTLVFDSLEGYAHTVCLVQSLAQYLCRHGWEKRVLFHIHDEPDIHYKDTDTLEARRRQYYLAAGILRKYLPGVRVIEAVDSAAFYGGIDIWVPGTAGYEARKQEFDTLIGLGETVWSYVCCGPEGEWLNRFLDFHLMRGRLLFWGFARNRISGFLHWGLNQFPGEMNPFEGTSCPNDTGIGTNFPCGDSFLVYPEADGPSIGLRLEAQRRGAEDAALWQLLRRKDQELHDRLLLEVFTDNRTYCRDPERLAEVYEQLLKALERKAEQKT